MTDSAGHLLRACARRGDRHAPVLLRPQLAADGPRLAASQLLAVPGNRERAREHRSHEPQSAVPTSCRHAPANEAAQAAAKQSAKNAQFTHVCVSKHSASTSNP